MRAHVLKAPIVVGAGLVGLAALLVVLVAQPAAPSRAEAATDAIPGDEPTGDVMPSPA